MRDSEGAVYLSYYTGDSGGAVYLSYYTGDSGGRTSRPRLMKPSHTPCVCLRYGIPGSLKKVFTCRLCGKVLCSKASLKRHIADKHSERQEEYRCVICERVYCSRNSLMTHIYTYHKTRPGEIDDDIGSVNLPANRPIVESAAETLQQRRGLTPSLPHGHTHRASIRPEPSSDFLPAVPSGVTGPLLSACL
uniref:C2H2-type domain-containing protein n=1 Tax=Timema douglasi TaxID=61478 RepID=A0A7R8VH21_TIMDO|nr:unnamed protein product [Timema douglasi]